MVTVRSLKAAKICGLDSTPQEEQWNKKTCKVEAQDVFSAPHSHKIFVGFCLSSM
jgi:hypothetical protein